MDPSRVLAAWRRIHKLPFGTRLFSRVLGRAVPYSGTIGARVLTLEPGHCVLEFRERRRVRNHLGSIHAIALVNAAELAGGLATLSSLGPEVRGIVTHLEMDYHKKARGTLTVTSRTSVPPVPPQGSEHVVTSVLTDSSGEVVCEGRFHWRLGQRPRS